VSLFFTLYSIALHIDLLPFYLIIITLYTAHNQACRSPTNPIHHPLPPTTTSCSTLASMAANAALVNTNTGRPTWQEKLQDHCRVAQLQPPVFNLVSDRRGIRTAWSSTVIVQGRSFSARYFYDGPFTNNAKEDAAEVAYNALLNSQGRPATTTTLPGQLYAQNQSVPSYTSSSSYS